MNRQHDDRRRDPKVRRSPPPARTVAAEGLPPEFLRTGKGDSATRVALFGHLQGVCGNRQVQRFLAGAPVSREVAPGASGAPGATTASGASGAATTGPVVDDAAAEVGPGQMRRRSFLQALRAAVEAEVSAADPVAQADARAHLPATFADLESQDAASLQRSLRENLPGNEGSDAQAHITAASAAVRHRLAGQAAGGPSPTGMIGRLVATIGSLASALFKARDSGTTGTDTGIVRGRLRGGRPLDAAVRAPLETAYGQDFSQVRVHTDTHAGGLSDRLGARAFTVGSDVAFAPGEYQPGTLVGDALIAHELAHVAQQRGGGSTGAGSDLEEDADRSAVGAMASRWGDPAGQSIEGVGGVMPRLRAGLRLQRCAGAAPQQRPTQPGQSCSTLTPDQWREAVTAAGTLPEGQPAAAMTTLARQALCDIGVEVRTAGTAHRDNAHPDDYAEVPVVNFDVRLNAKTRWRGRDRSGQPVIGPPVGDNAGYNFHDGRRRFAVIGPGSLDPNTPLDTRMYAQHELRVVQTEEPPHGLSEEAKKAFNDRQELQSWTESFRNYFHQYLAALPRGPRPTWHPLIGYYTKVNADHPGLVSANDARAQAVRRLVDYYDNPPVPAAQVADFRESYRMWMRKSRGQLITDLEAALPPGSR